MRFRLRCLKPFEDIVTRQRYSKGDIIDIDDEHRVVRMIRLNVAELVYAKAPKQKKGNKIVLYQNLMYKIGGIETADYHLARKFKDRNITFIFGKADIEQGLRLAQYCDVVMDDYVSDIECDVLILTNYDSIDRIKDRIKARKIYQQCHADWTELKKIKCWNDFNWRPDKRVDKVLAVSPLVQKSLKTAFDEPLESIVVPNILTEPEHSEFRIFLTLSRFSPEKGGEYIVRMAERFLEAKKSFVWYVCGDLGASNRLTQRLAKIPNIIVIKPSIENIGLLSKVDYYVSPSLTESYGYSIREALSRSVPVISTNIPIAKELIKDGKNGYIVDFDLSNLPIDKIFGKPLKFEPLTERVSPLWEKVLNGEL